MRFHALKLILFPIALICASCGLTTSEIIVAEDGSNVIYSKGYASEQNNGFQVLYAEANAYCNEQGKVLKPITYEGNFTPLNSTRAKLTFRCLLRDVSERR